MGTAVTAHEIAAWSPEDVAGRELRRLRIARGWSQEDVARRMSAYGYDWHQTMVAKTEAAQRPLRLNEAVDLCRLFGVPADALLKDLPRAGETDLLAAAQAKAARLERCLARVRQALDDDR